MLIALQCFGSGLGFQEALAQAIFVNVNDNIIYYMYIYIFIFIFIYMYDQKLYITSLYK